MSSSTQNPAAQSISGYDAERDSGQRSALCFPQSSRMELNGWTRRRLQEKNRAIEANFAFHSRVKSKFGRHVAGRGVFPFPITADPDWNRDAKALFEQWAGNPFTYSVDGSRDFFHDQRIVAEEMGAGDGEAFSVLTERGGTPMIQPLDPFEVGSLWFSQSPAGIADPRSYEDGVKVDEFLRPMTYAVCELPPVGFYSVGSMREVPAAAMVHVFRRRRAKQVRGLPPLYSSLNDGHDALDMLALAKASAKLHSLLAVSKRRKPQNAGQGITSQISRALKNDGSLDRLEEKFKGGAVTVEMDADEELVLHASERPTIAELDGIRFYCQLVSLGADLPFSVAFSFLGVGGTATRAELEDAQNSFEMHQDNLIWQHSQRIYTWRMAIAQERGEIRRCKDPHWWACDWHGPAKITVDYGRSAAANIDLMMSGLLSAPRYYEERAQDAYVEGRKQIDWIAEMQAYAQQKGVDFNRFMESTPGANNGQNPDAAPSDE